MKPDMQHGQTRGQLLDRIRELQAKLDAVEEYYRILEAQLAAVKEVESYSVEFPAFGRPATVMLTKDVLLAIGEQE